MRLRALHLAQFRNLATTTFEPARRFSVFWGDNGQGKTNFLEAIYLAGTLRSFRTTRLDELLQFGRDELQVKARVERAGLERVYEVEVRGARREARLDGKVPRHLVDYFGDFNVVLFAPEDLRVPRGSPADHRKFLDRSVFNWQASFLADAQRYARVLRSRNAVLRDPAPALDLLDVYDAQLASTGARIVEARRRYLEELDPRFTAAFAAIGQSGLPARLEYHASAEDLNEALGAARRKDLARGRTSVGPHVDDLDFVLDGRNAREHASQGQLRALVLAWKTAEIGLLAEKNHEAPLLLLDDVSSELDPSRNQCLFDFLQQMDCQTFVTTTHPRHVLVTENREDFRIVSGQIQGP